MNVKKVEIGAESVPVTLTWEKGQVPEIKYLGEAWLVKVGERILLFFRYKEGKLFLFRYLDIRLKLGENFVAGPIEIPTTGVTLFFDGENGWVEVILAE